MDIAPSWVKSNNVSTILLTSIFPEQIYFTIFYPLSNRQIYTFLRGESMNALEYFPRDKIQKNKAAHLFFLEHRVPLNLQDKEQRSSHTHYLSPPQRQKLLF